MPEMQPTHIQSDGRLNAATGNRFAKLFTRASKQSVAGNVWNDWYVLFESSFLCDVFVCFIFFFTFARNYGINSNIGQPIIRMRRCSPSLGDCILINNNIYGTRRIPSHWQRTHLC